MVQTVCQTTGILQLLHTVIDVPVAQVVHLFSRWCLSSVYRQSGGSCRYAATGTHSVKLCILGLVIDMPIIVHVKVVDITVVAQRSFLLVLCSRTL